MKVIPRNTSTCFLCARQLETTIEHLESVRRRQKHSCGSIDVDDRVVITPMPLIGSRTEYSKENDKVHV